MSRRQCITLSWFGWMVASQGGALVDATKRPDSAAFFGKPERTIPSGGAMSTKEAAATFPEENQERPPVSPFLSPSSPTRPEEEVIFVSKRNGQRELLRKEKVSRVHSHIMLS
jgi:hypothetical protein